MITPFELKVNLCFRTGKFFYILYSIFINYKLVYSLIYGKDITYHSLCYGVNHQINK